MEPLLYGLVSFLYCALAIYAVWQHGKSRPAALLRTAHMERSVLLGTVVLHGVLLYHSVFASTGLRFGFAYALSAMLWLSVVVYWLESLTLSMPALPVLLLPLVALCSVLPAWFPGSTQFVTAASWAFRLHLALAMLAYSLFSAAAFQAILMTLQQRRLHGLMQSPPTTQTSRWNQHYAYWLDTLPPLLTMERMLFRLLTVGFVLLTLTLISGIGFSEVLWHIPFRWSHKSLFALLSWLIFAILLLGRWHYGWRGRHALRWTLVGFAGLVLAYVGSHFVLEVILHRL